METYSCKPADLPTGFFWFKEINCAPVVVEKRVGESFVRFTNGRQASRIADGEEFIGPLAPPL